MPTASFCPQCGRPLEDGRCPVHDAGQNRITAEVPPRRRTLIPHAFLMGGVGLILVSLGVLGYVRIEGDLSEARARIDTLTRQNRSQQTALLEFQRALQALQTPSAEVPADLADVAAEVRASVFTVETGTGLGSAWVIESRGEVSTLITNYHVVADVWRVGGNSVDIVKGLGTFHGTIQEVSIAEDLAAISVPATFQPLPIATGRVRVGETVLVVGSPFGLEGSVSTGVVSAMRLRYMQFSAPVSPGDSGAPVVNERGQVVGVVARKIVASGAEGLSFAIPITTVCRTVARC